MDDGFYVEDDCPGISQTNSHDVSKTGFPNTWDGNGFGLSIVQPIAEAHNWGINLTEGLVAGVRFEITD